jgi:hypothetical protein
VFSSDDQLSHSQVNGTLNRLDGVDKMSQATAAQLRARIPYLEKWIIEVQRGR